MNDTLSKNEPWTLLLVRSSPVREITARALGEQGFQIQSSVNFSEAAWLLKTQGLPEGVVIAARLSPKESGRELLRRMSRLPATRLIPSVLVLNDRAAPEDEELPPHACAIRQSRSTEDLATSIAGAYDQVRATAERIRAEGGDLEAWTVSGEGSKDAPIDQVLNMVEEVGERVARGTLPGPLVPELLSQVRELFSDNDVEFSTISEFVRMHQVLAARLLSLANSAAYARGRRVKALPQAISRLGIKLTCSQLQMLAMRSYVIGEDPQVHELMLGHLRRASFVGLMSARRARSLGLSDPDLVETIGLFHNIGAIFLFYAYSLMRTKDQTPELEPSALLTVAESQLSRLNRLIAGPMKLASEVERVASVDVSAEPERSPLRIVAQVVWAADQVLEHGVEELELTEEAELLEIDEELIAAYNRLLPDVRSILAAQGV